ncbi:MAG: transketolase C-terminal domain-containing protein [Patescibacteria group bacterium]
MTSRPDLKTLLGKPVSEVPMSVQRILGQASAPKSIWIGPKEAAKLSADDTKAYSTAQTIMRHLCVRAPTAHASGHPGGPLSAFTFAYFLSKRRDPGVDEALRYSAGHLSLLAYGLQWMFGREGKDTRLASPQSIIDTFRTPSGLPGHVEAGIGDIPFGTGPLGKGVSNALGVAFGYQYLHQSQIANRKSKMPKVDVLLADGDSQEGQVMEAFRLAAHLKVDNLVVHGDWNDIQLSGLPSATVAADFAKIAEAAGWQVIEVQNGNDPAQVVAALDAADQCIGKGAPIFICYYTTMGHGITMMEEGSNTGKKNFHGSPLSKDDAAAVLKTLPDFDEAISTYEQYRKEEKKRYEQGKDAMAKGQGPDRALEWKVSDLQKNGYKRAVTTEKGAARKDFGATHLLNLMNADPRIVVLHADLAASGGFDKVEKSFPDRVINVGVAEGNMAMMAAGMRQAGLLPVTYTFAAFGTNEARASARLIDVNCGHTRCSVLHDCTHSGLSVGEDGETHQERHYLNIPFDNTQVWSLADSNQAAAAAEKAMELIAEGHTNVFAFSPRSNHPQILKPDGSPLYGPDYVFDGKADIVAGHGDLRDTVTVIATGITIHAAIEAAKQISSGETSQRDVSTTPRVRVLNVACVRPLDASAIIQSALETRHLIVVEDHSSEGGLATQVADVIADFALPCTLRRLGVNRYYPSATDTDLFLMAGLDCESIIDAVEDEVRTEIAGGEDAFVSAIYEMTHHLKTTRFAATARAYVARLAADTGYLESVRDDWKKRSVSGEQLPGNDQLLERLREAAAT